MVQSSKSPVNKSLSKQISKLKKRTKQKLEHNYTSVSKNVSDQATEDNLSGVSIITCTNKKNLIHNIFDNFSKQDFEIKELIIILNNNHMNIKRWKTRAKEYDNVFIYKLNASTSLGECLNFAINKAHYGVVAKFDDDDYYSPKYLSEAIMALGKTRASIVGKGTTRVYFLGQKTLALRTTGAEHSYVGFVNGSTLVFRKEVFKTVKFRNINTAEDVYFCRDCIRNGYRIFSTSQFNHIYIRYPSKKAHTWKISDRSFLKKHSRIIAHTDDYKKYAIDASNQI